MAIDAFIERIQASRLGKTDDPVLADYELPLVSVDTVILTVMQGQLKALLIQRKNPPYDHMWAIPGGFIHMGETLEAAAQRRLYEETNVQGIFLKQLAAFGAPERDPRARVVTVAFYTLCSADKLNIEADANAEDVRWFSVKELPELAFDHDQILNLALRRMREELEESNIAFQLLPEKFTLSKLQQVYELILGHSLDKRNFRKKMISTGLLKETGETLMEGFHRPAQLYAFKERPQTIAAVPA